jgi:gamma-glutamyltranspeptidase/glutathione hydrolase
MIQRISLLILLTFYMLHQHVVCQTIATRGMVVCDDVHATNAGLEILKQGGNAIDAAVATAFALAVTFPQAGNLGGGGFMVFMDSTSAVTTIDFREKAPFKASQNMYLDESGQLIEGKNHRGALSIGVPGTVAGLYLAHQKYGNLPWEKLLETAIDLAEIGIPLNYTLSEHAASIHANESPQFLKQLFQDQSGRTLVYGDLWIQKELAQTLRMIQQKGHDGFYRGEVAAEIERFMKENGGVITKKDLKKYKVIERIPVKGEYGDYEIYSMGPPSSGGVTLIEMLNMMAQLNLDSIPFNSADYYHVLGEVMRRAYADRAEYLGDPDFNSGIPVDQLISKQHASKRASSINMDRVSVSDSSAFGGAYESEQTTHLSVCDQYGQAVSMTYTLEQSYGSGMGSAKLGFLFNNEMGDFNPQAGLTNSRGLIGTPPNLIEPGKRMLSSMTPTIITKNDKPYLIIGTPGGRTIINTVFQTAFCVLEYDMRIDHAIEAPKVHHQWLPDRLYIEEPKISPDTRKLLRAKGHDIYPRKQLGRLMGIQIDPEKKIMIGACDSSSPDGAALGY